MLIERDMLGSAIKRTHDANNRSHRDSLRHHDAPGSMMTPARSASGR
jgi:hypothetical protein